MYINTNMKFNKQCKLYESQFLKTNIYPQYSRPEGYISPKTDTNLKIMSKIIGREIDTSIAGTHYPNTGKGWAEYEDIDTLYHENFHLILDTIRRDCEECYETILYDLLRIVRVGLHDYNIYEHIIKTLEPFYHHNRGTLYRGKTYILSYSGIQEVILRVQKLVNDKSYRVRLFRKIQKEQDPSVRITRFLKKQKGSYLSDNFPLYKEVFNRIKRTLKALIYYLKNLKKKGNKTVPGITYKNALQRYGFLKQQYVAPDIETPEIDF